MPSLTSSTVPTSRTSISARSAAWISLRSISLSSPGRSMESVGMGAPLGDCEKYHIQQDGERRGRSGKDGEGVAAKPSPSFPIASHTRSRSPPQESRQHPSRPHVPQLLRRRARYPARRARQVAGRGVAQDLRSEEHTSEL